MSIEELKCITNHKPGLEGAAVDEAIRGKEWNVPGFLQAVPITGDWPGIWISAAPEARGAVFLRMRIYPEGGLPGRSRSSSKPSSTITTRAGSNGHPKKRDRSTQRWSARTGFVTYRSPSTYISKGATAPGHTSDGATPPQSRNGACYTAEVSPSGLDEVS